MSQQINLFNPALVKKRSLITAINLLLSVFLLSVLFLLVWFLLQLKLNRLQAIEISGSQDLAKIEMLLQKAKENARQPVHNAALAAELKALQADFANRERAIAMLGENKFGNTDGYSDFLTAFARQIPAGVWITGFDLEGGGDVISVNGRALQAEMVPVFVSQLKREKIMQGKTFAALDMKRPTIDALPNVVVDDKKKNEFAPFIEFELHSLEVKEKKDAGGRTP